MVDGVRVMVDGVKVMGGSVVVMVEGVRVMGGVAVLGGGMACWGSIVRPESQNGLKADLAGKDGAWSLPVACARGSRSQRLLSAAVRRRGRFIGISAVMNGVTVSMVERRPGTPRSASSTADPYAPHQSVVTGQRSMGEGRWLKMLPASALPQNDRSRPSRCSAPTRCAGWPADPGDAVAPWHSDSRPR